MAALRLFVPQIANFGAGAGCCELAVRVVETGGALLLAWWRQGAGAGAGSARGGDRVPVPGAGAGCCELAVRGNRVPALGVAGCARGGDRAPPVLGAGAGCARWGVRVLGKLANCGAADFWSHRVPKGVDVVDGAFREHPHALVNGCQLPLGTVKRDQLPLLTMKGDQPPLLTVK